MNTEQMRDVLARCSIQPDACWTWTAAVNRKGYGIVNFEGKTTVAHRAAYQVHTGTVVPDGMALDHLCQNKSCINPRHLEVVTSAENTHRYLAATLGPPWQKGTCVRGHPLQGEGADVYMWTDKRGRVHRMCRVCTRIHGRAHDKKRGQARGKRTP